MSMLAWAQVNLINVQIPRGKPRLTVDKLLPKRQRKKAVSQADAEEAVDLLTASPKERIKLQASRAKARREAEEDARFWQSPEGRKLKQLADALFERAGGR
jgi:hypothetical protein